MKIFWITTLFALTALACSESPSEAQQELPVEPTPVEVQPLVVTEPVPNDSDDPAIWINPTDVMGSLIIGTDKDSIGGLYVFDLDGKLVNQSLPLGRPNNVDVGYGFNLNGTNVDFVVTGERFTSSIRIFSLPDMKAIDGGGIPLFVGEEGPEYRAAMGIAVYRGDDGSHYVIAGRKNGPQDGTYLWQYKLVAKSDGTITGEVVRKFGNFSGRKEIEAIAVDQEMGYIYYSDEQVGVRKYYADPAKGNDELALFGTSGFLDDNEGVTVCKTSPETGYVIVSDQARHAFRFFPREGSAKGAHDHPEIGAVQVAARNSDGSELTRETFNGKFPGGLFVAMSDDRTFHYYSIDSLLTHAGLKP